MQEPKATLTKRFKYGLVAIAALLTIAACDLDIGASVVSVQVELPSTLYIDGQYQGVANVLTIAGAPEAVS